MQIPNSERLLSPICVLSLHALLLVDVAAHRRHLREFSSSLAPLEWLLAAVAICCYLRTVICDPGVLRTATTKEAAQSSCPACLWLLCGLCGLCAPAAARDARDLRKASDAELQPIGRAVLDAMADEAEEDPGEEMISLEDLESNSAALGEGASAKEKPADAEDMSKDSASASSIQKRREAGENRRHRWQEQYVGPSGQTATQCGVKLRFCKVCQMHQPLRTKHCRDCGMCVRTHDHHCPWVGTCVGEGNRVYFYWFLVAQWLELAVFLVEGALDLSKDGFLPPVWLGRAPLLVLGMTVMGFLIVMVSCLVCFHSYLAMANMTTWENMSWHNISYLRGLNPDNGSPFSLSVRENLAVYCCAHTCPANGGTASAKRTEDGWVVWMLGDQQNPLHLYCCGLDLCSCCDME